MKIYILCDKKDRGLAKDILRMAKTSGIHASAYSISDSWMEDARRLDTLFSSATHIVAIYSNYSCKSSWLSFTAGLCIGSEKPLVLYRPSRTPIQATYLSPFFLVLSVEDMASFMETERNEWSAINDRREARRELMELGVSFRGDAFADSVREGNVHAVELFIRAGLSVDTRDRKGVPLICIAAREGQRAIVKLLQSHKADLNVQSEDRGNSALMDAVSYGYDDIALDLLKAGAEVDLVSKDGQSALIIAVGKNNLNIIAELLNAGANPDLQDKLGFSARKYSKLFHEDTVISLFDTVPEAHIEK